MGPIGAVLQAACEPAYSTQIRHFPCPCLFIEVQVLGDGQNVIHLYDRECSLQRRRQKILEEAPAPLLSEEVRERLCAAAVALARSVSYSSAGTIEFLYDDDTGEFFFIEMKLQATREGVVHHIRADDSNPFTSSICTRTFQIAGVRKHPKFTRPSSRTKLARLRSRI